MNKEDLETQCKLLCDYCAQDIPCFAYQHITYGNNIYKMDDTAAILYSCKAYKLKSLYVNK